MLKPRLIKYICQPWITPSLGPKLIESQKEREEAFNCTLYSKEGLGLRCGQFNLFKGNYRLHSFIDSFLLLLMAANEMVKEMQGTTCVKN